MRASIIHQVPAEKAYDPFRDPGKSYADGNGVDMKYNPAGQLKTLTEPGMTDAFGYNPAGQQTSSTAIDSQAGMVLSQVLAEDDQGRVMLTMSLDNGQFASDTNTYTALGQPLNESFGAAGNATVAHGYYPVTPTQGDPTAPIQSPDALASMTIQNLPSGQANAATTYGYDPASKRLQTITVNGVTFTIGYVQGSSGQIGSITTSVAGQTGNALTTTFGPYGSNASLLGTITATTGSGSQLYWSSLGYNANQQINSDLAVRSNVDGTQSTDNYGYSYGTGAGDNSNDANSLTQVKDNGNVTESYSYDHIGNFLDSSLGDANALNQYAALSYNLRGDVTADGTYTYTFDANDRMISVTPDDANGGGQMLSYGYDSQGRRIWKNVYSYDNANGKWDVFDYSRSYVYDGTQLVGELDGNGKLLTGYTWSPGGGLLAVTDYTQTTPKTYQAILDASGNTALLIDLTNGTVAASYTYDSYGNLLSATGPAQAICSILGKGLYYDLEARSIGHALNRDIRLNTWYERDPAGEIAGGANLYEPYGGDPINLSDTSGNAPEPSSSGIVLQLDGGPLATLLRQMKAVNLAPPDYASLVMTGATPGSVLPLPEMMAREQFKAWSTRLVAANQQVIALQAITPTMQAMNYKGAASPDVWGPIIQRSLDNAAIAQQQVNAYLAMAGNGADATEALQANNIDGATFLMNMIPGGAAADDYSQGKYVKGTAWAALDVVMFWAPWAKSGRAAAKIAVPLPRIAAVEAEGFIGPTIGRSGYRTMSAFRNAVFAKYQALVDQGYAQTMKRVAQGLVKNDRMVIGSEVDSYARTGLRDWLLNVEGIQEGPSRIIQVNRRLYDVAGTGAYRIPDMYIPGARAIYDATIAEKSISFPQAIDFRAFSGGANVTIVRPSTLITPGAQGSYGLYFP